MNSFEKVSFGVLGIIELVLRMVVVIVLICTILGLVVIVVALDEGNASDLFTPWCFRYIKETARKSERNLQDDLSRKQRRQLNYQREQLKVDRERNQLFRDMTATGGVLHNSPLDLG